MYVAHKWTNNDATFQKDQVLKEERISFLFEYLILPLMWIVDKHHEDDQEQQPYGFQENNLPAIVFELVWRVFIGPHEYS